MTVCETPRPANRMSDCPGPKRNCASLKPSPRYQVNFLWNTAIIKANFTVAADIMVIITGTSQEQD